MAGDAGLIDLAARADGAPAAAAGPTPAAPGVAPPDAPVCELRRETAALRLTGVGHAFGATAVLEGIDFALDHAETVALVGPSGCGKTTLLHLVAGLLPLREGTIANRFASTACMFQQPRLLPWRTAIENIALGLKARAMARAQRREHAHELGARLGLTAADLAKYPHELSGGMQSRVALARALVLDPQLLLLDEPFSALDIGLKTELYAILAEHQARRGMAVLMITHDLMEAVRLSDRILVMIAGPGRIARRLVMHERSTRADDAWVYRSTAALLQDAVVRASFGLPEKTGHGTPRIEAVELAHTLGTGAAPAFTFEDAPLSAIEPSSHRC